MLLTSKMNPRILVTKYECVECHRVPDDPHVAEDGCIYHERCIKEVFESFGNGDVLSPSTGAIMGRTIIRATNIRSLVKRIKDDDCRTHDTDTDEAQTNQLDGSQSVRGYLISEEGANENFSRAFGKCQTILDSDRHNGHALALLGLCYIHGHGVVVDKERGIELLRHGTQLGCGGFSLHVVLILFNPEVFLNSYDLICQFSLFIIQTGLVVSLWSPCSQRPQSSTEVT